MIYMPYRSSQKAFTIVEMVVVIVVIAILVAITAVSYRAVVDNANKQTAATDAQSAGAALAKYKADKGSYPTSLEEVGDIDKVQSTFNYTYNAATRSYCVTATHNGASAYVRSGSTAAKEGTCT